MFVNTHKLIVNFNKSQRLYPLIPLRLSHQILYALPRTFVYHNLIKKNSYRILSAHVQPNLRFSTSTLVNADIQTMTDDKKSFNVDYNDIVKAQNDKSILIIDVREKEEIDETGKLPGSIHIPMGDVANTLLNLSDKDFKDKFNRQKPLKNTKIILSCRSGKRSSMVQEEIQKLGYENAYNYAGGWLNWESNQKA